MDTEGFRALREKIESVLSEIQCQIKGASAHEAARGIEEAHALLALLRQGAEGEVQERSVRRLAEELENRGTRVNEILAQRDAGKIGDGNIAFKCTWNDRGYKAPCSESAYRSNLAEGRVWCSSSLNKCREYGAAVTLHDHPCYESIALKEMYFAAGWDHSGGRLEQPRHIRHAKRGKMAVLTTRRPGTSEEDRLVVGLLLIKSVEDDPGKETKIFGDRDKSIEVDCERVQVKFWDYYRNPDAEEVVAWNYGLFRYLSDRSILGLFKGIEERYGAAGIPLARVADLRAAFERHIATA